MDEVDDSRRDVATDVRRPVSATIAALLMVPVSVTWAFSR